METIDFDLNMATKRDCSLSLDNKLFIVKKYMSSQDRRNRKKEHMKFIYLIRLDCAVGHGNERIVLFNCFN